MNILGIDPGATTGWCLYDAAAKRALASGEFPGEPCDVLEIPSSVCEITDVAVLERPKGQGPTRPHLVECGIVFGDLRRRLREMSWGKRGFYAVPVRELLRLDVCRALSDATYGEIRVRNDATAWAALLLLHGGEAAGEKPRTKKGVEIAPGGPLGRVTGHQRAALAVAVALNLVSRAGPAKSAGLVPVVASVVYRDEGGRPVRFYP